MMHWHRERAGAAHTGFALGARTALRLGFTRVGGRAGGGVSGEARGGSNRVRQSRVSLDDRLFLIGACGKAAWD